MKKYYTEEKIYQADGGKVSMGCDPLRKLLAYALTRVPSSIVDRAFVECFFIMPQPEDGATYYPKDVIEGKNLIVFPYTLLTLHEAEQVHTVLHELAHYELKHKSPLEIPSHEMKKFEEIRENQEREANSLADQWIKEGTEQ